MKIFTRVKSWFAGISDDLWDFLVGIASQLQADPRIREIVAMEVAAIEAAALAGLRSSSLATGTQKFMAAQSAIFAKLKEQGIPAAHAAVSCAIDKAVEDMNAGRK